MAKYYECPTGNFECPYWDRKRCKCAMEVVKGEGPANECDEYDAYNEEEVEEEDE